MRACVRIKPDPVFHRIGLKKSRPVAMCIMNTTGLMEPRPGEGGTGEKEGGGREDGRREKVADALFHG